MPVGKHFYRGPLRLWSDDKPRCAPSAADVAGTAAERRTASLHCAGRAAEVGRRRSGLIPGPSRRWIGERSDFSNLPTEGKFGRWEISC